MGQGNNMLTAERMNYQSFWTHYIGLPSRNNIVLFSVSGETAFLRI